MMLVKGIIDEDFVNYKKTSMFIACHSCTFKCDKLSGKQVCQNCALAKTPNLDVTPHMIVRRYLHNPISKAIVFGGLEPFDDIINIIKIICGIRYRCNDDVVIYTGYTSEEVHLYFKDAMQKLMEFPNIIVKFGRFIPDQESRYDEVLGVTLASKNQYAVKFNEV